MTKGTISPVSTCAKGNKVNPDQLETSISFNSALQSPPKIKRKTSNASPDIDSPKSPYLRSMKEMMKVNKSYEDEALKSLKKYSALRGMYDIAIENEQHLSEKMAALQSELESCTLKLKKLEKDKIIVKDYEGLEILFQDLTQKYEKEKENSNSLESDLKDCNATLSEFQKKIESMEKSLSKERQLHVVEKEEADSFVTNLRDSLKNEEEFRVKLIEEIEATAEQREMFSQLKEEIASLETNIAEMKNSKMETETKNKALLIEGGKLREIITRKESHENEIDKLMQRIFPSGEGNQVNKKGTRISQLDIIIQHAEKSGQLKNELKEQKSHMDFLESRDSELNKEIRLLRKDLNIHRDFFDQISSIACSDGQQIDEAAQGEDNNETFNSVVQLVRDTYRSKQHLSRETIETKQKEVKLKTIMEEQIQNLAKQMHDISKKLEEEKELFQSKLANMDEVTKSALKDKDEYEAHSNNLESALVKERDMREQINADLENIKKEVVAEIQSYDEENADLRRQLDIALEEKDKLSKKMFKDIVKYEEIIRKAEEEKKVKEAQIAELKN